MTMGDQVVSLIRTWVPIGVGAALTWLASLLGVGLDANASAGFTAVVVALVSGAYYLLVRLAERRWPWVGVLLGTPRPPTYQTQSK